jgi:hypothetical protein
VAKREAGQGEGEQAPVLDAVGLVVVVVEEEEEEELLLRWLVPHLAVAVKRDSEKTDCFFLQIIFSPLRHAYIS